MVSSVTAETTASVTVEVPVRPLDSLIGLKNPLVSSTYSLSLSTVTQAITTTAELKRSKKVTGVARGRRDHGASATGAAPSGTGDIQFH